MRAFKLESYLAEKVDKTPHLSFNINALSTLIVENLWSYSEF